MVDQLFDSRKSYKWSKLTVVRRIFQEGLVDGVRFSINKGLRLRDVGRRKYEY